MESVNDGGAQGDYLETLGPVEVQGGVCLHLVLAWMHRCKSQQNLAPNKVWQEMKQPNMISQIANNQRGYQIHKLDVETCISLYHIECVEKNILDITALQTVANIDFTKSNMLMIVIDLSFKKELKGRHAIGFIKQADTIYMFDPNVGVLRFNAADQTAMFYVINYIYNEKAGYEISKCEEYIII